MRKLSGIVHFLVLIKYPLERPIVERAILVMPAPSARPGLDLAIKSKIATYIHCHYHTAMSLVVRVAVQMGLVLVRTQLMAALRTLLLLLVAAALAVTASAQKAPRFKACKRSLPAAKLNECVRDSLQKAVPELVKGEQNFVDQS
ncbi:hypothetical protein J6590_068340 [Homalodisca vitripennis]|nr:hypothetical protein J6590_068340 [Homalodisca vitripennis]